MSSDPDLEGDAPSSNGRHPPKLVRFRNRTGINTPGFLALQHGDRPGPNIGIYARVIQEEQKASFQYNLMSSIINIAFFGQIIVAATLTALGASNTSHIAITVLGSLNTIIAGIQTYLKGQGLPNRIHQYQFGLRKLREHIEDRERDFSHPDCQLDVDHIVTDISAMYQAVRQTAEDNTPDTYLPMGGAGKKLLGQKDTVIETPGLPNVPGAAQPGFSKADNIDAKTAGANGEAHNGQGKDTAKANGTPHHAPMQPGGDPAAYMDEMIAVENAAAEKAKGKENAKEADGETSGTSPNNQDETEDAPLLEERRKSDS